MNSLFNLVNISKKYTRHQAQNNFKKLNQESQRMNNLNQNLVFTKEQDKKKTWLVYI